MSNYHLRDKRLSLKAKGLLSYMLSLPNDWDYSLAGLCSICKEGKDAIRSTLKELKEYKYLIIKKSRNSKGFFEYTYFIYEEPQELKESSSPNINNPYLDKSNTENTPQINSNVQVVKDDKTTLPSFFVPEEHNKLTLELIDSGYIDENDIQIFYYDNLFEKLLEMGNSYKLLIVIIHYIVPRVIKRKFKDENFNDIKNKFGYFKNSVISNINKLNSNSDDLWEDINIYEFINNGLEI